MKRLALIGVLVFVSAAFIAIGRTSAQVPPATNDVNAMFIRELHDLRLAIEKLASATSQVQVLSARASQQEQRISNLTTQLITFNGKLAEAAVETSIANARLEQLKESLRTETEPKRRTELQEEQAGFASDVNRKSLTQSSLQAQVDAIRQQILADQSSLADIERKLDETVRPSDSQR